MKSLSPDEVDTKVILAYANYWLRWGVQRQLTREIIDARERTRKYRIWLERYEARRSRNDDA